MKGIPLPVLLAAAFFLVQILSTLELDADFLEDLPFLAAIAAFVLFRVFAERSETKRRGPIPMPMPEPTAEETPKDIGFKIPPLKGAPREAQPKISVETMDTADTSADEGEKLRRQHSLQKHLAEKRAREEKMEQERLRREHQKRETSAATRQPVQFSPDALKNAVIWAEVLGKSKALRRK